MRLYVLACCLVVASRVHAESDGSVSLADVLSSLDQHHPLISAEIANVRAAEGDALAARGEFDTLLNVQGRIAPAGYYDPKRLDVVLEQPTPVWGSSLYAGYRLGQGKIAPYYGEQRTLSAGELRAGMRVPVLQDGAIDVRRAGVRSTALSRTASEEGLRKVQLDLQRDATSAYYTWLAASLRVKALEKLVALAEVRNEQIAQKVTLGALPSVEAVDNQRSVLERKRQLILARRAFEKASIDLSLFLRDDQGRPRVLSQAPDQELPEPTPLPASPEDAIRRALSQRPELRQLEAQLSVTSVERELAQNRVLPRLDGFAEVSRDFGRAPRDIEYTLAPTVFEVGAMVSVPLYLRKARGKLRAADAKLEASRQKILFARDKVRAEVLDAWSQWRAAEERVALSRQSAEAAEKVASGERERFELGATSVLFVNLREQTAADAQISLIDAQAEVAYAAARAQLAMGEGLKP